MIFVNSVVCPARDVQGVLPRRIKMGSTGIVWKVFAKNSVYNLGQLMRQTRDGSVSPCRSHPEQGVPRFMPYANPELQGRP